jgi:hypothetical protein
VILRAISSAYINNRFAARFSAAATWVNRVSIGAFSRAGLFSREHERENNEQENYQARDETEPAKVWPSPRDFRRTGSASFKDDDIRFPGDTEFADRAPVIETGPPVRVSRGDFPREDLISKSLLLVFTEHCPIARHVKSHLRPQFASAGAAKASKISAIL